MLNVNDPNVFDIWRDRYDKMSDQEHFDFYNQIEGKYPDQAHYNLEALEKVIDRVKPTYVSEAGGWKGNAALHFLKQNKVSRWVNYELCQAAIDNQAKGLDKLSYRAIKIDRLDWFSELKVDHADLFLATHFIEHLSDAHFESLLDNLTHFPAVYFEAPITVQGENNWNGYFGTHILSYSWESIIKAMEWHGFTAEMVATNCYLFEGKK